MQVQKQLMENASKQQTLPIRDVDEEDDFDENSARKLVRKDLPLLYLEPQQKLRRFCFHALRQKMIETGVIICILLNAGCSALSTLKPGLLQQDIALHAELLLSSIFGVELLLRLIAYHPRAFLQSGWNCLDAVLVLGSSVSVCIEASPVMPFQSPISLQLLRTARTFRAARLIHFAPAVLNALSEALPKMMTLIVLCLLILFACSSMGVSMLSNVCLIGDEESEGDNALRCLLVSEDGKLPQHSNFSNILMSLLTLVRFSTGEGWLQIMHRSSLVRQDFPRPAKNALELAARALNIYRNSSSSEEVKKQSLKTAREFLPGCVTGPEMSKNVFWPYIYQQIILGVRLKNVFFKKPRR